MMNIREQIQDLLEKHPTITLDEVKKKLPEVKEITVKTYFNKLKRETKKAAKESKSVAAKSVEKPKVIATASKAPIKKSKGTEKPDKKSKSVVKKPVKKVKKVAASIKPATESKSVAKKQVQKSKSAASKRPTPKSGKATLKSKVSAYLDQKPKSELSDLQRKFPKANSSSLSTILRRWKKAQPFATKNEKPTKAPIKVQKDKTAKEKVSVDHLPLQKTMAAQEKTIAAQEKTIEAMRKTIDLLDKKERSKVEFKELAGMTIDEIKKVAAAYIRGLKDLPSKFKGQ
jgi:hypothetical protein